MGAGAFHTAPQCVWRWVSALGVWKWRARALLCAVVLHGATSHLVLVRVRQRVAPAE